ncbi:ATPase domain-containing protein [Nanobdella aerobiophila]|nr:ATPase domain-containing protein [Nanobdella aerobiophila]
MVNYIDIYLDRDEFADRLGGSIPKGSIFIIEGEDGAGKSIISQRLSYGSLLNKNKVTYISSELSVVDFVKQMDSLGYDIKDYLLSQDLLFISTLYMFGKIKEKENLIFELTKEKSRKIFDSDLIILDSLSYPLINGLDKMGSVRLLEFLNKVKNMEKTIIITYSPNDINEFFVKNIRRIADIYFDLKFSSIDEGSGLKMVNIRRFRYARGVYNNVIPFRVEPNIGLIVEISSYV